MWRISSELAKAQPPSWRCPPGSPTIFFYAEFVQLEHSTVIVEVKVPTVEGANSIVAVCEAFGASENEPLPEVSENGEDGRTTVTDASAVPAFLISNDLEVTF
jgi:hypothetical protein